MRLLIVILFTIAPALFCRGSSLAEVEVPVDQGDSQRFPGVGEYHSNEVDNGMKPAALPSFDRGGVVFFLHIPKTGGTSIRRNLEVVDRVDYVFGRNYSVYWDEAPRVEDAMLHGTKNDTVLFYEIHASDAPSFYRLRKRLERWRDTAKHNKVPVFFFSLVRDPLAYAFSHFSFFHVQRRNPSFEQCNATEKNFLRLSLTNPQCQFLFKGEPSLRAQKPTQKSIQPNECHDVQRNMWNLLDWVGTTERLSKDTLPLLATLLNLEGFEFKRFKVSNESGETFGQENVTASTIGKVLEISALDNAMYESVRKRYSYLIE